MCGCDADRQTLEDEVRKRIEDAGKRWRHRAVVQHKLELAKAIGSIAFRWKLIPGDDTRLEDWLDTAVLEVLQWPKSVQVHARIGSMGLRGSQEYRWVMMMILLLFLQKQNLAFAVYQFGSVLSLPD